MTEIMNPVTSGVARRDSVARTLVELLELEELDEDLYRTVRVLDEPLPLFGGQAVAQALLAAGRTVPPLRVPHSLHCYFLRPGDPRRPFLFRVCRDRDGGTYSARRVIAVQDDREILTLSASFAVSGPNDEVEAEPAPEVPGPSGLRDIQLPRVISFEGRQVPRHGALESRFWARCTDDLPDSPLIHACALAYLSDTNSRRLPRRDGPGNRWGPSIDHAIWFHSSARIDRWVLTSKSIRNVSAGRALYIGAVHDQDGNLIASMSQEMVLPERDRTAPLEARDG